MLAVAGAAAVLADAVCLAAWPAALEVAEGRPEVPWLARPGTAASAPPLALATALAPALVPALAPAPAEGEAPAEGARDAGPLG